MWRREWPGPLRAASAAAVQAGSGWPGRRARISVVSSSACWRSCWMSVGRGRRIRRWRTPDPSASRPSGSAGPAASPAPGPPPPVQPAESLTQTLRYGLPENGAGRWAAGRDPCVRGHEQRGCGRAAQGARSAVARSAVVWGAVVWRAGRRWPSCYLHRTPGLAQPEGTAAQRTVPEHALAEPTRTERVSPACQPHPPDASMRAAARPGRFRGPRVRLGTGNPNATPLLVIKDG